MNGLALCSGIGGLEIGVELALPGYRTVGYVERDAYAAAVLVARMEDKALEEAPVWDDLVEFDSKAWRGKVDIVTAGFPCQPFSYAGSRKGIKDDRWLWPEVWRVISEVRPGYVFLENVPGLVRRGLAYVLGDLAEGGFDAAWGVFSAREVGAPHLRKRVFILAAHPDRKSLREEQGGSKPRREGETKPGHISEGWAYPNPDRDRCLLEQVGEILDGQREARREDADRLRLWGSHWDRPSPEPSLRRMDDGLAHRMDRLRCLGNGVVPQQAARAFTELLASLECL